MDLLLLFRRAAARSPLAIAALLLFFATHVQSADLQRGEKVFTQCAACHAVGPDAKTVIGPPLTDVYGRRIGSYPGFKYSPAMALAGRNLLVWDDKALDALMDDPHEFMPGTPMPGQLADPADRQAVIALLKAYKEGSAKPGEALAAARDPEVSADILAIQGDPEYGEYLASECMTCHQADGSNRGIPSITGWPVQSFVTVMHAYKNKSRDNEVMQTIAGALGDEEIAGLAAWFKTR